MIALLPALLLVTNAAHAEDGWTSRIKFSGDMRYRNEWSITRPGGEDMRWRQRIRARLGMKAQVIDDQLEVGLRLRTGDPSDQNSPHETLGGAWTSATVAFDRAYLAWNPGGGSSSLWAGKFAPLFANSSVYGDFIWDGDVNPEGVAAEVFIVEVEDGVSWALKPAAYLLLEVNAGTGDQAFDTDDGYMFAAQSDLGLPLGEGRLTIANAFYSVPDATPANDPTLLETNEGNTVNAAGTEYVADFLVLDNLVDASLDLGGQELQLAGRVVYNFGASTDNLGWQVGAALPLTAGKVGLEPFVDVHAMQADAVYSDFITDDHQVGSGYMGAVAGLEVKPHKAVALRVWGIFDRADDAPEVAPPVNSRARVDVNARF